MGRPDRRMPTRARRLAATALAASAAGTLGFADPAGADLPPLPTIDCIPNPPAGHLCRVTIGDDFSVVFPVDEPAASKLERVSVLLAALPTRLHA